MTEQLADTDLEYLGQALERAEGGRGRVSPNPLVGAVIVRDGDVLGSGFHARLGGLHAERAALADCRERGHDPAGATMYVTLEPCAHQGRQPPCTEAILEAGLARVVIGAEDPTEKASGRGPGILRDGGIEVAFASGAEATASRLLNQPFRKHARSGLPLVILKTAMSLDGRTATPPGESPWISGEASRALVHRWRAESDSIAVGIGTALADDPLLTARGEGAAAEGQPLRVVFDSRARLPLDSQLLCTIEQAPVLVVASQEADPDRLAALRDAGAETLIAGGATPAERIASALADLGRRQVTSLFLEGGATLAASFTAADQIDEARVFVAPVLLGGAAPTGDVGSGGSRTETSSPPADPPDPTTGPVRLAALSSQVGQVGDDVLITARFKEW
jgi:diaminohydroxyphosphoribosylaminopyrimidine deaminase/5-amino-6-(5-phosphoribosylamino)uracil reductase